MRGLRRRVRGRVAWALLVAVLVVAIVLAVAGVALADRWTDISDATWVAQYGVSADQAATVAAGFSDRSFHPKEAVKRGQFAKMVVDGFDISYYEPSRPSFTDVPATNTFFKYVETAVKAGLISGYSTGTFKPNNTVSREQANHILGVYLSSEELSQKHVITGSKSTYTSLGAWYAAEGVAILAAFHDATSIASVHAPGTAYLVYRQIVKGSNGYLSPTAYLTRAQAVALILRVKNATFGGGGGAGIPTITLLNPSSGAATGGNAVVITGTNFTGVTAVRFGTLDSPSFTVNNSTQITATAPAGTPGTTVDVSIVNGSGTSVATVLTTKYSFGPPTITKLDPNGGSGAGNTSVTITGTGFTGVTTVMFGTIAAKSFTVLSPTLISAISPPGTTGTSVDVTVTTSGGTSAVSTVSKFTYGIPLITKIDPAAGPASGGNTVIITGSGFTQISGVSGVVFGTLNATSYTVVSTTQITAVVPAPLASTPTVDVVVTNAVGPSATSVASKYSYGPPTITKINPTGGDVAGGTLVDIQGTGFTGVSAVKFGSANANSFTVLSPTDISATAPPGTAGSVVEVTVTTPAGTNTTTGTANDYSYGVPSVTSLNPAAGPTTSGTPVIITGTNFVNISGVKFGTTNALSYTVNSLTQITAVAPAGVAGSTVAVTVINGAGASPASAGCMYSYGAPVVTAITPTAGPTSGATQVVITGTGFTGVSAVKFGLTSATYTVNSATQITATAPFGNLDTTVDVQVTTPAGTSAAVAADRYRYIGPPTVTAISPATGATGGGTEVTITGTYFVAVTGVKFGTNAATSYTVVNETQIKAIAPAGIDGNTVNVTVTTTAGTSLDTGSANDYTYGMPAITGLNPAAGPNAGGNTVVISGSGFVGVTHVYFVDRHGNTDPSDDTPYDATIVGSYTANQITVKAPNGHTLGLDNTTVDVRVVNSTGTSQSSGATKYAFADRPSITSIVPNGGQAGASVRINGSGFTGTAGSMTVTFTGTSGGSATATITGIDTTAYGYIVVTAPAQGTMVNPISVTVSTAAGVSPVPATFNYGVPTITSLSPAAGPTAGNNDVVINGTNLANPSNSVFFGGVAGTIVSATSTQLIVKAPAYAGGMTFTPSDPTVAVTVQNSAGTSSNSVDDMANKYSYGVPVVSTVSPLSGPSSGGNTITITGTGFTGVTGVKFATVSAVITENTPTEIKVTAPAQGSLVSPVVVSVTTSAGTGYCTSGNRYTFGAPVISSVSPVCGPTAGGTAVAITGAGFTGATLVTFAGATPIVPSNFTVNSAGTEIDVASPAHVAGTVAVTVTTTAGTSVNTADDLANKFTYGIPDVTSLSPAGGPTSGGNTVTINGTGFEGITAVRFGGTSVAFTVVDLTHITATAPAGSAGTTVDVTVSNSVGTSLTDAYSRYAYGSPTVSGVSPAAGITAGGNLVVITGTNFAGITNVKFGTVDATFTVNTTTQITAIAPAAAGTGYTPTAPTVDITVINGAGTSTTSYGSEYTYDKPAITSLTPSSSTGVSGGSVVITGYGFTGVTDVTFAGASVSYVVNSSTQITATAPAGTVGTTVDVRVQNSVGWSGLTTYDQYAYGVPVISSLSVGAGPTGGGNTLYIYGSNFKYAGTTTVKIGTTTAVSGASVSVNDAGTTITVIMPASGSVSGYTALTPTLDISVVTGAGPSANTQADDYTYGAAVISNLNPTGGSTAGGNLVYITGYGFSGIPGTTLTVTFASTYVATIYSVTPTLIVVYAPFYPTAGGVAVTVNTSAGASNNVTYTYN